MDEPAIGGKKRSWAEAGSLVLMAASVWLGWEMVRDLAKTRLPSEMAIRLAPSSPSVLSRAAESEFAAKRYDNAQALAAEALERAPFDVRALRVLGLARAENQAPASADEILTLAGNWSLRDDPSHAWLMEYRLKRGDFRSSFAHADTLARRRENLWPQLFALFTNAIAHDRRAVRPVTELLAARPDWRHAYISSLLETDQGLSVATTLAQSLEDGAAPYSDVELSDLYIALLGKGYLPAMAELRDRLGRPPSTSLLANGDFSTRTGPRPFEWSFHTAAGMFAEVLEDDLRDGTALRAQYGSFSANTLAEQTVLLKPGPYRFNGEVRTETGDVPERLAWHVSCQESGQALGESSLPWDATAWMTFSFEFVVPAQGCTAQWVRLAPRPGSRMTQAVAWFDKLSILPAA